jgi:succinate dehydrogenase / fumarate reductase iron-sulfur subunit
MKEKKVTFKILRYKPAVIDPPEFQEFKLSVIKTMSVLDCLEKIRLEQDPSLMYRHSCHHSSCGTCACKINGEEKLSCITKVFEPAGEKIILEPLERYKQIGDLVCDMHEFYRDISPDWTYLKATERLNSLDLPAGIQVHTPLENCIECGACVSACPVFSKNMDFMGPAALSAIHNEIKKSPQKKADLMSLAGGKRGEGCCERALACSRVCPTAVYPARHIADLRRRLKKSRY